MKPQHPWSHLYPATPRGSVPPPPPQAQQGLAAPQHFAPVHPHPNKLGVLPGCPVGSMSVFLSRTSAAWCLAVGHAQGSWPLGVEIPPPRNCEKRRTPSQRGRAVTKPFPRDAHRGRRHTGSRSASATATAIEASALRQPEAELGAQLIPSQGWRAAPAATEGPCSPCKESLSIGAQARIYPLLLT